MSPPRQSDRPATDETDLFDPVQLGPYVLANRIVMAPLTRSRATLTGEPTALMAEYYGQRASAGLIIAEGTNISPVARGYAYTPGLYDPVQVDGWRSVTEAVHLAGGRIFVQLWHVGRISHPSLQPGGELPVAPSAIRPNSMSYTTQGFKPCVTPRALSTQEIPEIVEQYRLAARNAMSAGFDGVEIHAANGYLLDQFLRNTTNRRTDLYGGSIEGRSRLLLEVTEVVAGACGAQCVGIRLSPVSTVNDCAVDGDVTETYGYVVEQLNRLQLGYVHVIEGVTQGPRTTPVNFDFHTLRRAIRASYIANNGYDRALAEEARRKDLADLVAFGRAYISNPDLVARLRRGSPLNTPDRSTFFGGGPRGYIDYPTLDEVRMSQRSEAAHSDSATL